MEVDVLYNIPKDLAWQHINRFVRPSSINLAIYRACTDPYTTKKTIWNTAGRLTPGGIFVIQTCPEFVSNIISWMKDKDFYYEVFYYHYMGEVTPLVVSYKNLVCRIGGNKLINVADYSELGSRLMRLCHYGETCLFVGDDVLPFVSVAKKLGRLVVAFGKPQSACHKSLIDEGVKEVKL